MADARQLRLDSERAFRLARAGCRKFFDELNDLGWDLQLQAHKVERDAHKMKSRAEKTTRISISPRDNCADVLQELVRPSTGKYLPEKFEIVPVSIRQ